MDAERSDWLDGRRTWDRVAAWLTDVPSSRTDRGDDAVSALGDIRQLRWLLDQAELVAVRRARQAGKPWAEIATRLGVSRQSAWEKWRDLDVAGERKPDDPTFRPLPTLTAAAAAELVEREWPVPTAGGRGRAAARDEIIDRAARRRRRSGSVTVPNVVGMPWPDAVDVLLEKGLVGVGPDGPGSLHLVSTAVLVVDQTPEAGAKVPADTAITLWTQRGGGAGVREPRRPRPTLRTDHGVPEDADEAVS